MKGWDIKKIKFILLVLFIVLSVVFVIYALTLDYSSESLRETIESSYAPTIVYFALMLIASATTIPYSPIIIPAIFLFSFRYAVIVGFMGVLLGGLLVYYISRVLGKDFVNEYVEKKGGRLKAFNDLVEKKSLGVLILVNTFYFAPSNVAHALAGVTKTRFLLYFIVMAIGNFLNFFGFALLSYGVIMASSTFIILGAVILVSESLVPLYIFREHLKEVFILTFSKKGYQKIGKKKK